MSTSTQKKPNAPQKNKKPSVRKFARHHTGTSAVVEVVEMNGNRFVVMPESDFLIITREANRYASHAAALNSEVASSLRNRAKAATKLRVFFTKTGIKTSIENETEEEGPSAMDLLDLKPSSDAQEFMLQTIGETLKAARKVAKLTQIELAKKLDRSQALISAAERGTIDIGEDYVSKVLKACGLPTHWGPNLA